VSAYFDMADMAAIVGQANIDRYFSDDGSGVALTSNVDAAISAASALADGVLMQGGWGASQLATIATDDVIRMHIAWMAIHFGARRKPEWRDDMGRAHFHTEYTEAMAHLKNVAKADLRSVKETTAGTNVQVGGHLNSDYDPPTFVFAGTDSKPAGSGGF